MALNWVDRINNESTVDAEDINSIAHAVEDLENDKADKALGNVTDDAFATKASKAGVGGAPIEIIDNLESTDSKAALSAKQGKILNEKIAEIGSGGGSIDPSVLEDYAKKEYVENIRGTQSIIDLRSYWSQSNPEFYWTCAEINTAKGKAEGETSYVVVVPAVYGIPALSPEEGNYFLVYKLIVITEGNMSGEMVYTQILNGKTRTYSSIDAAWTNWEDYTPQKDYDNATVKFVNDAVTNAGSGGSAEMPVIDLRSATGTTETDVKNSSEIAAINSVSQIKQYCILYGSTIGVYRSAILTVSPTVYEEYSLDGSTYVDRCIQTLEFIYDKEYDGVSVMNGFKESAVFQRDNTAGSFSAWVDLSPITKSSGGLFTAYYNSTKYDAIAKAVNAGKIVRVYHSGKYGQLTEVSGVYRFSYFYMNGSNITFAELVCDYDDKWTATTKNISAS